MGFGHRVFLVDEQDVLRRVPSAKFERLHKGEESLPEYAGRRVRCADVMVELENRALTGWYREWYYLLPFDNAGMVPPGSEPASFTVHRLYQPLTCS